MEPEIYLEELKEWATSLSHSVADLRETLDLLQDAYEPDCLNQAFRILYSLYYLSEQGYGIILKFSDEKQYPLSGNMNGICRVTNWGCNTRMMMDWDKVREFYFDLPKG